MRYRTPGGLFYSPYLLDLIDNNHVLIAGTTGSGKSVLENAIIYSLLCTKYPGNAAHNNGCKLVFIDPKKVELDIYKNLPHTLYYSDNIVGIEIILYNIRLLIDDRLHYMKKNHLRTFDGCPVYIFIDELVDLIESNKSKSIIRLLSDCASISRATNIFFIVCTQSPARSVIPSKFKLLFNCRIALKCNNAIESRQIIDDTSAVNLPRHGLAIVQNNLDRYMIEIKMKSDSEIIQLVKFWEKQHAFINLLARNKKII